MLPLIRTLFDIALMRKGPEAIPRSWLLLIMSLGLWLFSSLSGLALIERFDETDFFHGLLSGMAGIVCYAAVIILSGHSVRFMQAVTALIGCGALIFLAFVAEFVLFMPFVGERLTGVIANLILLWSVPVEGHIIARAINRHWYIGVLIAIAVFVLQYILYNVVASEP